MREDLMQELENDYLRIRMENEKEETMRRDRIRRELPQVDELVRQREELVYGTMRDILKGHPDSDSLPERMAKLSAEIREKLEENGFPADYLSPVYRCPVCRDTGKTGEPVREPCECLKKAYRQKLREKIGLHSAGAETFDHFRPEVFPDKPLPGLKYSQREQMSVIRRICEEWADSYPRVSCRDLLLTGKSGLGKTFLLHAMAERLIERDADVLIISAYRLVDILRRQYFSNEETSESDIADAEILMIDDLGSEPMLQNVTVEQLFNLLNERQSRGLSTLISTNLDMVEFRNRYTERIASRMTDGRNSRVITLEGTDVRTGGGGS